MSFAEVLRVYSLNLALQIGLQISSGLQVTPGSKDSLLVQLALLCCFTVTLTALAISALCPPEGNQLVYPAFLVLLTHPLDHHQSSQHGSGPQRCPSTLGSLQPMAGPDMSSGGQVLVGACFSEGCGMRLSGVTCCLTELCRTRWKGRGECQVLDVVEMQQQRWNAFERRVGGKVRRRLVKYQLDPWPASRWVCRPLCGHLHPDLHSWSIPKRDLVTHTSAPASPIYRASAAGDLGSSLSL